MLLKLAIINRCNVNRQKTNWLRLTLWLPSCYLAVIQRKKEIESAKTTLLSRNLEASYLSQHYGVTCKSKVKTINTMYFEEGGFVKSWTKPQIFSRNVYKKRLGFYAFSYVGCPLERRWQRCASIGRYFLSLGSLSYILSVKIKMSLRERPLGSVKLRTTQKCRKNKDDLWELLLRSLSDTLHYSQANVNKTVLGASFKYKIRYWK